MESYELTEEKTVNFDVENQRQKTTKIAILVVAVVLVIYLYKKYWGQSKKWNTIIVVGAAIVGHEIWHYVFGTGAVNKSTTIKI